MSTYDPFASVQDPTSLGLLGPFVDSPPTKTDEVLAATQEKVDMLKQLAAEHRQRLAEAKGTTVDVFGLELDSVPANVANLAASIGSSAMRMGGNAWSMPFSLGTASYTNKLQPKDYEVFNKINTGKATPEEVAYFNAKQYDSDYGKMSPKDVFAQVQDLENIVSSIGDSQDYSMYVEQGARKVFDKELADGGRADLASLRISVEGTSSDTAPLAYKISHAISASASIGNLIANAVKVGADNPVATMEYMGEQVPMLALGSAGLIGKIALAETTLGYAGEYYNKGMQAYKAKNGGEYPPEEQRAEMLRDAISLAGAEYVGTMMSVSAMGLNKAVTPLALMGKAAGTTAVKEAGELGLKSMLKGAGVGTLDVTKNVLKSTLGEAGTEGYQTYAEGQLLGKPASDLEIYKGATIGGLASGGITAPFATVAALTGNTEASVAKRKAKIAERKAVNDAILSGNADAFLDPTSKTYDLNKGMEILHGIVTNKDAAPDVRMEASNKAQAIYDDMQSRIAAAEELLNSKGLTPDVLKKMDGVPDYLNKAESDAQAILADRTSKGKDTTNIQGLLDKLNGFRTAMDDTDVQNAINTLAELPEKVKSITDTVTSINESNVKDAYEAYIAELQGTQDTTNTTDELVVKKGSSQDVVDLNVKARKEAEERLQEITTQISELEKTIAATTDADAKAVLEDGLQQAHADQTEAQNNLDWYSDADQQVTPSVTVKPGEARYDDFKAVTEAYDKAEEENHAAWKAQDGTPEKEAAYNAASDALTVAWEKRNTLTELILAEKAKGKTTVSPEKISLIRSMGDLGSMTPEEALAIADDTSVDLTEKERNYLRKFSAARVAYNAMQDVASVTRTVINGDKANKNKSITDYRNGIAQAIRENNFTHAMALQRGIEKWAANQLQRAKLGREALNARLDGSVKKQINIIRKTDNTWESTTDEWSDADLRINGGFSVSKGSGKLIAAIEIEADALQAASLETADMIAVGFDVATPVAATTDASVSPNEAQQAPVEVEATQAPVVAETPAEQAPEVSEAKPTPTQVGLPIGTIVTQPMLNALSYLMAGRTQPNYRNNALDTLEKLIPQILSTVLPKGKDSSLKELTTARTVFSALYLQARKVGVDNTVTEETPPAVTPEPVSPIPVRKDMPISPATDTVEATSSTQPKVEKRDRITRAMVQAEPDTIFLFGDNLLGKGFGGQAKEMRGEPNAIGIPTKRAPSMQSNAFFSDATYEENVKAIDAAFAKIPPNTKIAVPTAGLGTGLAQLDTRAPKTFAYLQSKLAALQNFNGLEDDVVQEDTQEIRTEPTIEVTEDPVIEDVTPTPKAPSKAERVKGLKGEERTLALESLYREEEHYSGSGVLYSLSRGVSFLSGKFTQNKGKGATTKPLASVPYFFSTWRDFPNIIDEFIKEKDRTPEQNHALGILLRKVTEWMPMIDGLLVKQDAKFESQYLYESFMLPVRENGKIVSYELEENVKAAIAYAVFSFIQNAGGMTYRRTPKEINALLQRQEDFPVSPAEYKKFSLIGERRGAVVNDLGQRVVESLGVKANKDTPVVMDSRLQNQLGDIALRLMFEIGAVTGHTKTMSFESAKASGENFIRFANVMVGTLEEKAKKETIDYEILRKMVDADTENRMIAVSGQGSQSIVSKMMGVEEKVKEPSLKPVETTSADLGSKFQDSPSELLNTLNESNKIENFAYEEGFVVLDGMDSEYVLEMMGKVIVDGNNKRTQKTKVLAIQAVNEGLERSWFGMKDFINKTLKNDFSVPFFLKNVPWSQNRAGIEQTIFNPQADKAGARFLMTRKEWQTTIDRNNTEEVNALLIAVALALDIDIDKKSHEAALNDVTKALGLTVKDGVYSITNPVFSAAVEAIYDRIYSDADLTDAEQRSIVNAVAKTKTRLHGLQGLIALANMLHAQRTDLDSFTVHLIAEADGVTNGPMLTNLLWGTYGTPAFLERGGFFGLNPQEQHKDYNVWRGVEGRNDLYEDNAKGMVEHLTRRMKAAGDAFKQQLNHVYYFTKPLIKEDGTATSAARKIVKTSTTQFHFGSGMETLVTGMFNEFLSGMYDKMEDVANAEAGERAQAMQTLVTHINGLLPEGLKIDTTTKAYEEDRTKFWVEFEFSDKQLNAMASVFQDTLGDAIEATFNDKFQKVIKVKDAITTGSNLAFNIYNATYQYLRDMIGDSITFEQEEAIRERIKGMLPTVATQFSKESDNGADARIPMMGKRNRRESRRPGYRSVLRFKPFQLEDGTSLSTMTTYGYENLDDSPSVSMVAMPTHSLDSRTSHGAVKGTEALNIHDADLTGVGRIVDQAHRLNTNLWNALLEYSPVREVANGLMRTIQAIPVVVASMTKEEADAYISMLAAHLKQPDPSRKANSKDAYAQIVESMTALYGYAAQADTQKLGFMANMAYLSQYAYEGGALEVTDAMRQAASAKLMTVDKAFTPEQQQAILATKPLLQTKKASTTNTGTPYGVTKIISGGQTGGDRGGLEAGKALGLQTGGTAPKGYRTETGDDASLKDFGVTEHALPSYPGRTEDNVVNSDATIIFNVAEKSPGSDSTVRLAKKHGKPYLVVSTKKGSVAAAQVKAFLEEHKPATLNIAGNRESSAKGLGVFVKNVLVNVLTPTTQSSPPNTAVGLTPHLSILLKEAKASYTYFGKSERAGAIKALKTLLNPVTDATILAVIEAIIASEKGDKTALAGIDVTAQIITFERIVSELQTAKANAAAWGELTTAPAKFPGLVAALSQPNVTKDSLVQALKAITSEAKIPYFDMLLNSIMKLIPDFKVVYLTEDVKRSDVPEKVMTGNEFAQFVLDEGKATLYVRGHMYKNSSVTPETILHELVHSVLSAALVSKNQTDVQKAAIAEITKMYELAKVTLEAKYSRVFGSPDLIQNLDEFITYGITNKEFMIDLQGIAYTTEGLFKAFVRTVFKALGLTQDKLQTVFGALINNVSGLIAEQETNTTKAVSDTIIRSHSPAATVRKYTTVEIFDGLSKGTLQASFEAHLKGILNGIVNTLHGPFGTLAKAVADSSALSPLDVYAKAVNDQSFPFVSDIIASGFVVSEQEQFVAEQIEATVRAAIEDNEGHTTIAYTQLTRMFNEAYKKYPNAQAMLPNFAAATKTEQQRAEALHAFLFKVENGVDGKSNHIARFAAMVLGVEEVNALFQYGSQNREATPVPTTFTERLLSWFNKVLNAFESRATKTYSGQKADVKMESLLKTLVGIEMKKRHRLMQPDKLGDRIEAGTEYLTNKGKQALYKFGNSRVFTKSKNAFVGALGTAVRVTAQDQVEAMAEATRKVYSKAGQHQYGLAMGVLNEMRGATEATLPLHKLGRISKRLENQRKGIMTTVSNTVLASFGKRSFSKKESEAMTKYLIRSGAFMLLDTMSLEEIEKLFSDESYLKAEITKIEQSLNGLKVKGIPGLANFYITTAKALGHSLMTEEDKTQHVLGNAIQISTLAGTEKSGKVPSAITTQAIPMIDKLATLQAILSGNVADQQREMVANIMREQLSRGDKGNGVHMTLLAHKHYIEEATKKMFKGKTYLVPKGFVPEVLNPHVEVMVAGMQEDKRLRQLGYSKSAPVELDRYDNSSDARIYTIKGSGMRPWLSGVFSYSGLSTRYVGKLMKRINPNTVSGQIEQVGIDNQVMLREPYVNQLLSTAYTGFDPTVGTQLWARPTINDQMKIIDYKQVLPGHIKDSVQERNNNFSQLLGTLASNVFDSDSSLELNEKVVRELYDFYHANKAGDARSYVRVSPLSSDPEIREIALKLPKETREAILKVWGPQGMLVRYDTLDLLFGYRKSSATDAVFRNAAEGNMYAKIITDVFSIMFARTSHEGDRTIARERAQRWLNNVGDVWEEIVAETKDIIVMKTGIVMLNNITSNYFELIAYGLTPFEIWKYWRTAILGARAYHRDADKLAYLKHQLEVGYVRDEAETRRQIALLENDIARNPVSKLIEEGLMPTIVEDVASDEDAYSYKSGLTAKVNKHLDKHKNVQKVAKFLYMSRDGWMYQTLSSVTQHSDFIARYALYQHMTNKARNPMTHDAAIQAASDAFINYDIPSHRKLQWANDMGFVMFTKYLIRIQKVILYLARNHPLSSLTTLLLNQYIDALPMIYDSGVFGDSYGGGLLHAGALEYPGVVDNIATLRMLGL